MNSILYLWAMSLKNWARELRKKPAILIMYLLFIGLFILMFNMARNAEVSPSAASNFPLLKILLFLLASAFMIYGVYRGLQKGGSFFGMSDVNFLFVSPVNPRIILLYGTVKQIGFAFLAGILFLFQSPNLKIHFGLGFSAVLMLFVAFAFTVMSSEAAAMFIYSKTNGNPKRQNIVKIVTVILFAPAVISMIIAVAGGQSASAAAYALSKTVFFDLIPVAGWITKGCTDIILGNTLSGLLFFALMAALDALFIVMVTTGKIDYYEEVLCATELNYEKRREKAEGNINDMSSSKKVKVSKAGVFGSGASAFFSKHLIESRRGGYLGILSFSSLLTIGIVLLISLSVRGTGNIMPVLGVAMWLRVIMIGRESGVKEFMFHYIYIIPENPVKKLLFCNAESMLKIFIEALLIFIAAGLIFKAGVIMIACCVLAYIMLNLLLLSANSLSMRIFRQTLNRRFLMLYYMIAVLIIITPGIVLAVLTAVKTNPAFGLLALSCWEAAAALILFNFSKGVIHNCDMITARS